MDEKKTKIKDEALNLVEFEGRGLFGMYHINQEEIFLYNQSICNKLLKHKNWRIATAQEMKTLNKKINRAQKSKRAKQKN